MQPTNRPFITPEIIERFAAYYSANPTWGSLHIVLDDLNLETSHVAFCVDWAERYGDVEGKALAEILLSMTRTQRAKIGRRVEQLVP